MTIVLAVTGIICGLFTIFVLGSGVIAGILSCAIGLALLIFRLVIKKKSLKKQAAALVSGTLAAVMLLSLAFAGLTDNAARTAAAELAAVDRLLLRGGVEDTAKALELLEEMQSKYPNSVELLIRQAQANSQLFNDDEAAALLNRCAADLDIRYYLMKASEEIKAGREAEARDTYVAAAAIYTQDYQIQFNAGFLSYIRGDMTKAEFYLLRACILEPKEPRALFFLATVKCVQGDYAAARGHLEKAASLRVSDTLKKDIEDLLASLPQEGA
ncbi:tetratricopeptide repeat protein [Diplocloster modestus]|uniref:Tetratricopeptide repeat protein n=1 Tax=Diplocloster modestus TaxID=2850322 RepID=A0ABS6KD80_9FIRM|nr:hypothetical protein [Diplocloster modestus]MBU9728454.1 hypothetical protein [Diplocloster modestus]